MKILIIRTSAMGDIVHCLPVLSALRRQLPEARIGWVIEQVFAPLLADHPHLDLLVPVRLRHWRHAPFSRQVRREFRQLWTTLRRWQPDVALDLMGNHKGAALARLSGAPRRIGARRGDRREGSSALWINEPATAHGEHAVDRALALLAPLRLAPESADFGGDLLLPETPPEAEDFLAARQAPYVLIQPGAGWGNKRYPTHWWGEVARRLSAEAGVEVWIPVAPGEEDLAARVVASSGGTVQAIDAGPFTMLLALLRHCRLLLGGDTGPLHLAHALGTPVLCLLGPTDPARFGPYGATETASLYRRLPCSFCHQRLDSPRPCLLTIPPAAVSGRAMEILSGSPTEVQSRSEP